MFWRTSRVDKWALLFLATVGLIVIALVENTLHTVKQRWFDEKVAAAKLAEKAQQTIRSTENAERIVIDPISDPNETGLIGEQFTIITTDQGNLEAKLTTTNPDFAAVVVHLLKRAGVKKGGYVAISCTGSMPGLNIAVLSAAEAIGAKPVIISSIGASMWGANNPDFSWLDMENFLFKRGIFHYKSVAASIGGRGDRGGNLSPDGRKICREIIKRNGVPLIEEKMLDDAIKKRYKIFKKHLPKGKKYSAYINVGGGLASIGSFRNLEFLPVGLIKQMPDYNYPIRGTMILFGKDGVPVINLRDVKKLAKRYGLPIAPQPMPKVPSGGIFFKDYYNVEIVAAILLFYALLTFVIIKMDIKSYVKRRTKKEAIAPNS